MWRGGSVTGTMTGGGSFLSACARKRSQPTPAEPRHIHSWRVPSQIRSASNWGTIAIPMSDGRSGRWTADEACGGDGFSSSACRSIVPRSPAAHESPHFGGVTTAARPRSGTCRVLDRSRSRVSTSRPLCGVRHLWATWTPLGVLRTTDGRRAARTTDVVGVGDAGPLPLRMVDRRMRQVGRGRGVRIAMLIIGAIALLIGALWIGQGLNLIPGSAMSGDRTWLYVGILVVLGGVVLLIGGLRRRPPAPDRR
jgi:hypothetical protein